MHRKSVLMKTRALQRAHLHQHGDSTFFMKLPPCEQVNLILRSLAVRAHSFVFGQNSVGMYAFTLSGDGTKVNGQQVSIFRELWTAENLWHHPACSVHSKAIGISRWCSTRAKGLGGVYEALRCLWTSKAWEVHSAGFCAPSEVWWRPPMDLHRAAADETPRRALTGEAGLDLSGAQILSLMSRLRHVTTMAPLIGDSASGPFPIHISSTDSLFPWRCCGDSACCLPLEHNYTKHWSKLNFPAVISACTFLCSPSLEALALPRSIISPRSLFIPRTQTAVMFVAPEAVCFGLQPLKNDTFRFHLRQALQQNALIFRFELESSFSDQSVWSQRVCSSVSVDLLNKELKGFQDPAQSHVFAVTLQSDLFSCCSHAHLIHFDLLMISCPKLNKHPNCVLCLMRRHVTLHPTVCPEAFSGFKLNLLLQSDQFLTILHPFVVIFSLFVVPLDIAYLFSDVT